MPLTYRTDMAPLVPIHQNLAVAVGAAKDHARALLERFEREGDARTGRSSAVYLALVVMHERLLSADPPTVAHLIPDLQPLRSSCNTYLASVQHLLTPDHSATRT